MKALVDLAFAVHEKEKASGEVSPMVQKALEKHRQETEEAASNDIVALLRKIDSHKLEKRQAIRKLKAQLKKEKDGLDALDRAWAYAQNTNNFLPVLALFGLVERHQMPNPSDYDELTKVPADFKTE